jgi:hypothetical protein
MFDVGKSTWRRSALWLLFPSVLFLIILFISHSANSHISPVPSPAPLPRTEPRADHHPNKRRRPLNSNPNFLGFYRLKLLEQQPSLEK